MTTQATTESGSRAPGAQSESQAQAALPPDTRSPVEGPVDSSDKEARSTALERVTGGYATQSDKVGTVVTGAVGAVAARWSLIAAHPSAGLVEEAAAAFAGGELTAGTWAGSGERARRWFRTRGTDPVQTLSFTAVHVHPMAVAVFAPKGERVSSFLRGAAVYLGTMGATAAIVSRPEDERQTVAWGATAAISALSLTAARPPRGWGWLGPAYSARMLIGHASGR